MVEVQTSPVESLNSIAISLTSDAESSALAGPPLPLFGLDIKASVSNSIEQDQHPLETQLKAGAAAVGAGFGAGFGWLGNFAYSFWQKFWARENPPKIARGNAFDEDHLSF